MNELHGYGSHSIELELIEIKPGAFRWIYFIDGEHFTAGPHVPQSEDTSRDDALLFAHLKIEEIDLRIRTDELRARCAVTNFGPADAGRVSLVDPSEVHYWMDQFGVSKKRLTEAVVLVVAATADVEALLTSTSARADPAS